MARLRMDIAYHTRIYMFTDVLLLDTFEPKATADRQPEDGVVIAANDCKDPSPNGAAPALNSLSSFCRL